MKTVLLKVLAASMAVFTPAAIAANAVITYPGFESFRDQLPSHLDGGVTLKAAAESLVCVGKKGLTPGLVLAHTQTVDTMKFRGLDWQTQYRSYVDIGICEPVEYGQEFKVIQLQTTCLLPWSPQDKRRLQANGQHCFYSPIVEYKGGQYMLPENALLGIRELAVERLSALLKANPESKPEVPKDDLAKILGQAPVPVLTEQAASPY